MPKDVEPFSLGRSPEIALVFAESGHALDLVDQIWERALEAALEAIEPGASADRWSTAQIIEVVHPTSGSKLRTRTRAARRRSLPPRCVGPARRRRAKAVAATVVVVALAVGCADETGPRGSAREVIEQTEIRKFSERGPVEARSALARDAMVQSVVVDEMFVPSGDVVPPDGYSLLSDQHVGVETGPAPREVVWTGPDPRTEAKTCRLILTEAGGRSYRLEALCGLEDESR
jgi:hypothetical protein